MSRRPKISLIASRKYSPYRVFLSGKARYFSTEEDAEIAVDQHLAGKPMIKLGVREVDEVIRCKQMLEGTPLIDAVRYFLDHHPATDQTLTFEEITERFIPLFHRADHSPKYSTEVMSTIRRLNKAVGKDPIRAISTSKVQEVLDSTGSAHTQRQFRKVLNLVINFAITRQVIERAPYNVKALQLLPIRSKRPDFFSLEETRELLSGFWELDREMFPAVCLQLFAGIRTFEIPRMRWELVDQRAQIIDVIESVAKMNKRRVIDWIPASLKSALGTVPPQSRRSGMSISPLRNEESYMQRRQRLTNRLISRSFRQNPWRHTYASYAVAYHRGAKRVVPYMGHTDEGLLWNTYRDFVTHAQAKRFFAKGILPW
tara:strand:+ start:7055 stop:8167 length:1113 start_codon:yes stop_codon:yes gene_type:complete